MSDAVARFTGLAEIYDRSRPRPPVEITEVIKSWSGIDQPVVVDLGAGTGLSSALWSGRARAVHAVEPAPDMRQTAASRLRALPDARIFHVHDATAQRTGLPSGCADVVTAGQALHWLDPATTFPEVVRLLRPGGVFAAFDCLWPPRTHPEVDAAYVDFERLADLAASARGNGPPYWPKSGHAGRLRESGMFRFVTEISLRKRDSGDATRLLDVARSQGGAAALLAQGVPEASLGLDRLGQAARRWLTADTAWWWTYRVWLARV